MTDASGTGGVEPLHRSRASVLARSDLAADEVGFYDRILANRPAVEGPFGVLIHSADLAARVADVGSYIRFESELPVRCRCLTALAVARHFDCAYMWAGWAPQAEAAGLPVAVIEAIGSRIEPVFDSEEDRVVWSFGAALLADPHRVPQVIFDEAVEHLGLRGVVELAACFGYFAMLTFVLNGFEVAPHAGAPALPI